MLITAPVIVLNMHYSGLGIARNLAHLPIPVFGLSNSKRFPGNHSKHCQYVPAPDSHSDPDALRDLLIQLAQQQGTRPLVLPTRDHDVVFLNRYRDSLSESLVIPQVGPEKLDQILNKSKLYAAAARSGIACPRHVTFDSQKDLQRHEKELQFPCVAKPPYAHAWRNDTLWNTVGRRKAVPVSSFDELNEFYSAVEPYEPALTVQEMVPGPDENLVIFGSYVSKDGQVSNYFTARKLLQYPDLYGTGVVVEHQIVPEIVEMSLSLLRDLGFYGISEIEYKLDQRTGEFKLIEINPRHWDQHELGSKVGVNLTEALYRDWTEDSVPQQTQSPATVRWISESDLFFAVLEDIAKGGSSTWKLLRLVRGSRIFSIFDASDLKPFGVMLLQLAREVFARLYQRVRRELSSRPVRTRSEP